MLRISDAHSLRSQASRRKLLLGLLAAPACLGAAALDGPTPTYAAPDALPAAALAQPGNLIFTDGDELIFAVDINTGSVSQVSTERVWGSNLGVVAASDGSIFVQDSRFEVNPSTTLPSIVRFDIATGTTRIVLSSSTIGFSGFAIDRDDSLVNVDGIGLIQRVDPANGNRTTISSGGILYRPSGAAIELDGNIVVTAESSQTTTNGPRRLVRVNRTTGRQGVLSEGGLMTRPFSPVIGPSGKLYVSDPGPPSRIFSIDRQTGAQQVVFQAPSSSLRLRSMAPDQYELLYMAFVDGSNYGVARVDPHTGAYAVISRASSLFRAGPITILRTPTAVPCPTRSPISVRGTNLGGGRLQVNITATGNPNYIRSVTYGQVANAVPERAAVISGATAEFVLKRTGPGGVTFPFTVADACGDWKTFVGGGPNAF